ncbi:hypothetical protein EG329_009733 [Mollisiaceae sp. DMI_Dod_QoI]|nr:hypothetical protein EG329_009733 [Helotiales sp. DMI_Dod_QoI]
MAALHDALKTLGPLDFSETPIDDLKPFLTNAFSNAQVIVDSVPIPAPPEDSGSSFDGRSRASSTASNASEISLSSARSDPPPSDVEALQKEWKQVKMNARDNPLGMNVYKLGGKDGKGSWFARRSVHEGLGFTKWKKALELEFPETMKVQGGPGEGNIRGIGGERRVAYKDIEGVGKVEVYLLSAQFPGPTTPRDFVTMFITSDQALSDHSGGEKEVPRHFMVISRPCNHPDTPPRDGFIRGYYESVEFIREIPIKKPPQKSASTTNLPAQGGSRKRSASTLSRDVMIRNAKKHSPPASESGSKSPESIPEKEATQSEGRVRGHTISFDKSRGIDAKGESMDVPREFDECETNPIEWIMITRSDPGGSVPRFMIERGTPGGIVADASKFLNWACAKDMEDFESDGEEDDQSDVDDETDEKAKKHDHKHHQVSLHNYQTNGHLAGIEEAETPKGEHPPEYPDQQSNGGLYDMAVGAAGAAAGYISAHAPQMIQDRLPGQATIEQPDKSEVNGSPRRGSVSSIGSASTAGSFASALENYSDDPNDNDASSTKTTESAAHNRAVAMQDKELQRLEDKKRKIDEKLNKAREKELSKKTEDSAKEEEAVKRAEEKHEKEVKKQEEKYRKEVEKLEKKKEKEERKAEERKRKAAEKDERTKLLRELEELKAEVGVLRKEKEILRSQVGDLQAENTALAARVGKLGAQGEEVLKDVRAEVGRTGRLRASSLKALAVRPSNFIRSSTSLDKEENVASTGVNGNGSS